MTSDEQCYRDALQRLDVLIWEADVETMRASFVSQRAEVMLGHPVNRWLAEPGFLLQILHAEDRAPAEKQIRDVAADGQSRLGEFRVLTADGRPLWFRIEVYPTGDESPEPRVRGLMVNVTEQHEANKRFNVFLESAPDAIVIVDADGRMVQVNHLTEEMFGFARRELIGQPVEMLVPQRYRKSHVAHRSGYVEHPKTRPMGRGRALAGAKKDGSEFPIEISLSPLQSEQGSLVISIIRDLTERIKAEAKFRGFLESAPDAVVVIDREGRISIVNSLTEKMFGYSRDELLGQAVEILVPERYRHTHVGHRDGYSQHPKTRPMGAGQNLFGRRKDGSEFPVEISLSPLETEQGTLVTSIIRDITERKNAEEQIQSSLREKEVLLKEIHHRVKNNLQVTSSLLKLQSGYIQDPQAQGMFAESQNRIRSMALVHEKLYQSSDLSRINFAEYVESLAALLFRSYGIESGQIQLHIEGSGIFLSVESAVPCGLIVNELLSNCLKHAFPNGRRGRVEVRIGRGPGEQLLLVVADDGVGLPPTLDVEKTESLGLQLVRTLAQQLDGHAQLVRGERTEFNITFPEART